MTKRYNQNLFITNKRNRGSDKITNNEQKCYQHSALKSYLIEVIQCTIRYVHSLPKGSGVYLYIYKFSTFQIIYSEAFKSKTSLSPSSVLENCIQEDSCLNLISTLNIVVIYQQGKVRISVREAYHTAWH